MSAIESTTAKIRLPFQTARALVHQCEREYLLPRQVIARSAGQSPEEPVIIKVPEQERWYLPDYKDLVSLQRREETWRPLGDQKKVYLSILSQLALAMPEKFAAVAPALEGTKRKYFGRSRSAVESTGKENEASRIPDTEWWTSVNRSHELKQKTLTKLMEHLGGFSADYIDLVSWAPCRKFPVLSIVFE